MTSTSCLKIGETESISITGHQIAAKMVSFMEKKTLRDDGGFHYALVCGRESTKECMPKQIYDAVRHSYREPVPHFGHAILAFHYFANVNNGDSHYESLSKKSLEYILSKCEKNLEWCFWGYSPLGVYYKKTQKKQYKNAVLKTAHMLDKEMSTLDLLGLNGGFKLKLLYDYSQKKYYKDSLLKHADSFMKGELSAHPFNPVVYSNENNSLRALDMKAIWSLVLPSYMITKDNRYLEYIKKALQQADISNNLGKIKNGEEMQICIYNLEILSQMENLDPSLKQHYREMNYKISAYLFQNYADTEVNPKYNSDYGFVENGIKDTLNNGWLVKFFLMNKDRKYQLKKD